MNAWANDLPHLLRPLWLLALLVLPLLWWLWRKHARADTPWKRLVDSHLLANLLQEAPGSRRFVAWLFAACYLLAVLALAGPAWRQPVALYAPQAPLVIVQDMSSHMLVADMPPSRLLHARLKLQQLIDLRKGGQVGLVAYAGDAFTVAPLSDDAHSLGDMVVALTPDTMPVDGQRADRGLHRAADLLAQAGFAHGTILLLSDDADVAAQDAAREVHAKGYDVDVLGIGTSTGAPLPSSDGTFAQAASGAMSTARLHADALQALARAGGGRYAQMTSSAGDLAALDVLDTASASATSRVASESANWRDGGPFLVLALLPLVALGFRRGWLMLALLAIFAMPVQRAQADEAGALGGLWQRADQRADQALRSGDAKAASALAQTPEQKAAAAYRNNDYATAARTWSTLDSANANYNRGNALAQLGKYPDAIAAYQHALQLHPGMTDAQVNLALVKRLQQQKDQQQNQPQNKPQQDHQGHESGQNQSSDQQQGKQQKQDQQQAAASKQNRPQPASPQQDQQKQQPSSQQQDDKQQAAPDQKKQAQADAAEQRAIQQALKDKQQASDQGKQGKPVAQHESQAQREQRQATEALLQRVPDDPGALLRRKFALEYARRQQEGEN